MPASQPRAGSRARSLAEDVRGRSDAQLRALISRRPDLARPAPADLTSLAARASTRASVQRALDGLDRGGLQVLEALVVAGDPVDTDLAASLLGLGPRVLLRHVEPLWERALVWRGVDGWHVVRTVTDVMGPYPAGLGPSLADQRGALPEELATPEALAVTLDEAPPDARAVLDRLAWGPPIGVLSPSGPMSFAGRWLLTHHLLTAMSSDQVCLPREVALHLRGGRLHRDLALEPAPLTTTTHTAASVDAAAGGQASDLLGLVDELAADWGPRPPRVLRAGGLSVRDLRRVGSTLDVDPDRAAFLVEAAFAAGLVADDGALEPVWAPTPAYDEWQQRPSAERWVQLATAWLATGRAPHLVGGQAPGGGTVNALSSDVLWPMCRQLRWDVLRELDALPVGEAPDRASLTARIGWRRPLRTPANVDAVVAAVLREAEWLGVTGRGALGAAGRALVAGDDDAAAVAMAGDLPAPVEHVLLQADLTAVAPGRLEGRLAQFMRMVADVESRGGATVHRFSAGSVRRALDAGWTSAQVLSMLQDSSTTPVPQPLAYLVGDVARRHGQTRVGSASTYVRSDDEAVLDTMVAERAVAPLQLRRIAPTVLVSPVDSVTVLEMLRDNGFAPVAETMDGGVVVPPTSHHRTPARRQPATPTAVQQVDDELADALVSALRAGEESADFERARQDQQPGGRGPLPSTDPTVTLALLREAAVERDGVWIGYADAEGRATRILFYPRRIEGGRAYGTVEGSNVERAFSIHRVTGAALA
ncbi:helicase-associated domain-containing protein [Oryzihumus sp.]